MGCLQALRISSPEARQAPRDPFTSDLAGGGLSCAAPLPLAASSGSMSAELWGLSQVPLEGLGLKSHSCFSSFWFFFLFP